MPLYLGRFAYTSDAIKALVGNPQDRAKAAAEAAESLGAKVIGLWYAFGEFDGVLLIEAPDNATRRGACDARWREERSRKPRRPSC